MVSKFSVGKSSYGDLRGVEQFVMSARIALQVLSVIADFNAWQKARGAVGVLSVNEGMRSRVRQSWLWANRFVLGIVVAFPFTSLHDEVLRGNATDFGITMPDGSNRALTAVEFAKLHELVESRGGTWTGKNFGEPWHHEMATRTERLAPYPDAAARAAGKTPTVPHPDDTPSIIEQEDDDMKLIYAADKKSALFIVGAARLLLSPNPKTTTPLGTEKYDWLEQAKLAEKACRVNQKDAWSGLKLNGRELQLLSQLIGRATEGN